MLKVAYYFNWLCIGLLGLFALLMLLDPNKNGGDAATKGLGSSLMFLALALMAVLTTLNLLPWNWSKYLATLLIFSPLLYTLLNTRLINFQRAARAREEEAKPILEDPNQDRLARVIRDGDAAQLQQLLPTMPPEAVRSESLLRYAIEEASGTSYEPEKKLQCIRVLMEAGAPMKALLQKEPSIHASAANANNAAVLRFLFEQGADPNVRDPHFDRPYIFDVVSGFNTEPVQVFLDYGADPNATAVFDPEDGPIPPLLRASVVGGWKICVLLIERGARPDFKTPTGKSCAYYMEQHADGMAKYGNPEDQAVFAKLQQLVKK